MVNADGTFVASGLPEASPPVPRYDMKERIRLDSRSGVWKLTTWEEAQHLHSGICRRKESDPLWISPHRFKRLVGALFVLFFGRSRLGLKGRTGETVVKDFPNHELGDAEDHLHDFFVNENGSQSTPGSNYKS